MSGRFTVSGSTLSLLNVGEQGIVTRVTSADRAIVQNLVAMGVVPGSVVTLEQRSSQYQIKVDQQQFVISYEIAQAIYVRLAEALPIPTFQSMRGIAQIIAILSKRFALKPT